MANRGKKKDRSIITAAISSTPIRAIIPAENDVSNGGAGLSPHWSQLQFRVCEKCLETSSWINEPSRKQFVERRQCSGRGSCSGDDSLRLLSHFSDECRFRKAAEKPLEASVYRDFICRGATRSVAYRAIVFTRLF